MIVRRIQRKDKRGYSKVAIEGTLMEMLGWKAGERISITRDQGDLIVERDDACMVGYSLYHGSSRSSGAASFSVPAQWVEDFPPGQSIGMDLHDGKLVIKRLEA